ncbi:MAG TPA: SOS response-associated peptidase [Ktedonosporobacter sp.]|nr:SOS response-associated peptidase [Ktedonosporobacter sp.]
MCGRFTLTVDINSIARAFNVAPSLQTVPRYNIAPTQDVVAVMSDGGASSPTGNSIASTTSGAAHLELLRWGLIPSWAKEESVGSRMINARAETLAEKPSFKRLLRSRRCLILADGFYEWKQEELGGKTPMYITLKDHEPFAFAGLWDAWKNPEGEVIRTCTIITTQPNDLVSSIHNRMPAILSADAREEWLDPGLQDEHILLPLLGSYPADAMSARPVSRLVNNPKYDSAELIA